MASDRPPAGTIFQMACVVPDLEAALAHWTGVMGVGPFFRFPLPLQPAWLEMDGERTTAFDILGGCALAQSGGVQIELIEPGRDPSPYGEFLAAGRQGLHHVGVYARDYDAEMAAFRAKGIGVAMEGELPLSRFAYLRTDTAFPGTMLELIEPQPAMLDLFATIADAAIGWDGRDPVRAL
jgi:catechol 2,3-dioxygenase-like lactoylglutathione lyase family enzyme